MAEYETINGIPIVVLPVDELVKKAREESLTFKFVGCDGYTIEAEANNGKTYLIESSYEDPLQYCELPTNK